MTLMTLIFSFQVQGTIVSTFNLPKTQLLNKLKDIGCCTRRPHKWIYQPYQALVH